MVDQKVKKRTSFVIVDLIEDKIKSRGIFVLISLLFYIYITWTFLVGKYKFDSNPNTIEIALDFPHVVPIGTNVSEYMTPQVRVLNKNGIGIPDVEIEIIVVKISTDTQKVSVGIMPPI